MAPSRLPADRPRRVTQAEIRENVAEGESVDSIEPETFETNWPDWAVHAWRAHISHV